MTKAALFAVAAGLATLIGTPPAAAFWQRSQVSVCADATTEAERLRHRCWELKAYADPGWPMFAPGFGGAYFGPGHKAPDPRRHKGVTRRLG